MREQKQQWSYTSRTLSDGTYVSSQASGLDGWIHVTVTAGVGHLLYQGIIPIEEAFSEFPFLLDRAREFNRLWEAQKEREAEIAG